MAKSIFTSFDNLTLQEIETDAEHSVTYSRRRGSITK